MGILEVGIKNRALGNHTYKHLAPFLEKSCVRACECVLLALIFRWTSSNNNAAKSLDEK